MKKAMTVIAMCLMLSACGANKKEVRNTLQLIDQKIEDSKKVDCDTIKAYLLNLQIKIRSAIDSL